MLFVYKIVTTTNACVVTLTLDDVMQTIVELYIAAVAAKTFLWSSFGSKKRTFVYFY